MINNIEGGNVDLSDYYTKTEVDEKLSDVDVDLTGYYTAEQVDTEISNAITDFQETQLDNNYVKSVQLLSNNFEYSKPILQEIYDNYKKNYNIILNNDFRSYYIYRTSSLLGLYFIAYNGGRFKYTFVFSGGVITDTEWPKRVNLTLAGDDVAIEADYSLTGAMANLDEQFTYIKNNYTTEEDVNELINTALGVIENGTY